MEQIRSFIAIELPEEVKSALVQVQGQLKRSGQRSVKWVDPNGIHLTLKFLGNIASHRVSEISRAIEQATRNVPGFRLELKGLGAFPSLNRVQVIWVGLGGELEHLKDLQERIESSLNILGFPAESRSFTAHLTLARVREGATPEERRTLGQLLAATRLEGDYSFVVDALHLMRSQLTREGAIYSRLSEAKLG